MTEYGYDAIEKGMKLYRERNPRRGAPGSRAYRDGRQDRRGQGAHRRQGLRDLALQPGHPGKAPARVRLQAHIYLTALTQGYAPEMPFIDAPLSFTDSAGQVWQPRNYNNEYHGAVTMRRALELSLNTATVRLLESVGVPKVIELGEDLHMNSNFSPEPFPCPGLHGGFPAGSGGGLCCHCRRGCLYCPHHHKEYPDRSGRGDAPGRRGGARCPSGGRLHAYRHDEGRDKTGDGRKAAGMPYFLAGKTGTTNDFRDAWFVGFSPSALSCLGRVRQRHIPWKERIGRHDGAAHLDGVHV